jgi:hypothetical protein
MPELMIDLEITEYIDTIIPDLKKSAGPGPVKKAVKCLLNQDPDEVLEMYLADELGPWMTEKVESFKRPEEDPAEITISTIRDYISKRYRNFLEYADYHTSLAGLDQQGGDVLHEIFVDLLLKPESKLIELYSKKKKQYRELDFFILKMIKLNCGSKTSPYRWRYKQPLTDGNHPVDTMDLKDYSEAENYTFSFAYEEKCDEPEEEDYKELISTRFQIIRDCLAEPQFTELERLAFTYKFFLENTWTTWKGNQSVDNARKAYHSAREKVIAAVEVRREKHQLRVIHDVFRSAKSMEIRLHESEFIMLRQLLSDLQSEQESIVPPGGARAPAERLEKRMLLKLEEMIKDFDVDNSF